VHRSKGAWLHTVSQTVAWSYIIALAAFLVSFFVRDLLNNWLIGISDRGLIIFLPAILLVTFFLGLGPAILTVVLSALSAWYFFLPPYHTLAIGIDGTIVLATFVVGSGVGIALVHWLRISIRAAEALARQREVLIETDPNGILVVDAEGRIQLVNGQLTKLFGYSHNELMGQPVERLLPERYRRGHVGLRAEFSEHPTNRPMGAGRELYGLRKDGSEFPVEIGLASFLEGNRELILANVVDITERKQREQAQTKYLSMLDAGFDAIIVRDAQARITDWNRGAERLYGCTREEAIGRVIYSLLQTNFPKPLDEILADLRRNGNWEGELIQTRKDGARIVVFSQWTPEWDAKKEQLVSILQTSTDITDRKQAEARVAADLRDMTRLVQLSNHLVREGSDFNKNLNTVVDTAIAITGADKANLQLLDPTTGALTIAAQRGFEDPFLKFFASVRDDAAACAAAMTSGEQVVVEDVRESKIFAWQPSKDVLIEAGVQALGPPR
jgi:PAS domain S-box-containing protein